MTVEHWLQNAVADAERRGLPELKPLLEALAKTVAVVRAADFNQSPVASRQSSDAGRQSSDASRQP
jgi:hypothetical protein